MVDQSFVVFVASEYGPRNPSASVRTAAQQPPQAAVGADAPSGPVLSSRHGRAEVYLDAGDADVRWYIRSTLFDPPQNDVPVVGSPFSYQYTVTAEESIAATVRFLLTFGISPELRESLAGARVLLPLEERNQEVRMSLLIPYRDSTTGTVRDFDPPPTAEVDVHDPMLAGTFRVHGDAPARAAYAALSEPEYLGQPVRLRVDRTFTVSMFLDMPANEMLDCTVKHSAVIPITVPCRTNGKLYVQETPKGPRAVGCQPAANLGRPVAFEDVTRALEAPEPIVRIYRLSSTRNVFVAVAATYSIARAHPASSAVRRGRLQAYSPFVWWEVAYDAQSDVGYPVDFLCRFEPNVSPSLWAKLEWQLGAAYGTDAVLKLPTQLAGLDVHLRNSPFDDLALSDAIHDAHDGYGLTMTARLPREEAHRFVVGGLENKMGTIEFNLLEDALPQWSGLVFDGSNLSGPWPDGPITAEILAHGIDVHNHTRLAARIRRLILYGDEAPQDVATSCPLAARSTLTVPFQGVGSTVEVDFEIEEDEFTINEREIHLEDFYTQITLVHIPREEYGRVQSVEVTARCGADSKGPFVFDRSIHHDVQVHFFLPLSGAAATNVVVILAIHLEDGAVIAREHVVDLRQGGIVRLDSVVDASGQ